MATDRYTIHMDIMKEICRTFDLNCSKNMKATPRATETHGDVCVSDEDDQEPPADIEVPIIVDHQSVAPLIGNEGASCQVVGVAHDLSVEAI